ncbi:chorismate transformation enzyme, FkbO/Hyg5 family [Acidihalobacter prosperus]|uniref:Chorismatase FkbO/Hyg5-like N-terminal domain-containing protein n=1 Tax=Acidihalobacter prosperus TaxID=160660 RepID=A0A1A6C4D8_9GAMM|nr:hypothetical protein [Acidihalobacter prosperus]OBS09405.1 hypothetical protein Thpro_021733 [Acidihalobacter prosperus]
MNAGLIPAYTGPFGMAYVPDEARAELVGDRHTLALIDFGARLRPPDGVADFPVLLPQIGGPRVCEYWHSAEPVVHDRYGRFEGARTSELLFLRALQPDSAHIEHEAQTMYAALLETLRASGYPYLVRVWNYLPRINLEEAGRERYQSFCVGRAAALEALRALDDARLPAASGLGSCAGGLQIFAVAAREPGVQIENPRQVSAFRYPPRYGPRSPSFSRATLKHWREGVHLYISGTASIVGHASLHETLESQLGETLANIEAVVREAHRAEGLAIRTPDELSLIKVYLRDPADAPAAEAWLRERLGPQLPMLFLHGDVCRSELLAEIEGAYFGEAD